MQAPTGKTRNGKWRTTWGALFVATVVALLGGWAATATHNQNHGGEPSPSPTTSSPAPQPTGPSIPPMPPGGYFTAENGQVSPTATLEYDWQSVEIRATTLGVHFNINQQARNYDSSADAWTQVFHLNAPFRDEDYVSFCAPTSTITIQIRDRNYQQTIHEATLSQVPPC